MGIVQIRPAHLDDAPALTDLTAQLGYDPVGTAERLEGLLDRPGHRVLVAAAGEQVVGWAHVHESHELELPPHATIAGLVVADAHRRTGVGSALLAAAEAWAAGRGLTSLRLRSNRIREGAHAFYPARGYEIEKTQTAFLKRL